MDKKLQSLAWSVLPKEFKEEVKKEYNYYAQHDIYEERMWAYIEIFGQDNLTSDAEGEEITFMLADALIAEADFPTDPLCPAKKGGPDD